jgi:hypothetical protein
VLEKPFKNSYWNTEKDNISGDGDIAEAEK